MSLNENETEPTNFHSENTVLLVARLAKITGWVIAAIYLVSFFNELVQLIPNLSQLPPDLMSKLLIFINMIFPLAIGAFYVLVMQGVAQGLYIGLDLFLKGETEEEEEG